MMHRSPARFRAPQVAAADPDTNLLLHMDGAAIDATGNYSPVVAGVELWDSGRKKFGTHSFDGTNNYENSAGWIEVPYGPFVTGNNATFEMWVYFEGNGFSPIFFRTQDGSNRLALEVEPGMILFSQTDDGSGYSFAAYSMTSVPTNQWFHIAAVLHNGVPAIYLNGTNIATAYANGPMLDVGSGFMWIGGRQWTDEVRISSVARYTSDFTPPDQPFTP